MEIEIGQQAPEFTLYDTAKKKISLSDYKGKNVVLLFFPFAFSSVCTKELCGVRDNFNKYQGLQAEVIGISVDSLYTLGKFREDQNLNFTLLSDFNKEVSKAYNSLYDSFAYDTKGVSKRSAFVIDKLGKIRYAEVLENPGEQPQFGKIQEVLSSLN